MAAGAFQDSMALAVPENFFGHPITFVNLDCSAGFSGRSGVAVALRPN